MKRILPIIILSLAVAAFGCSAQKKPLPQEKIIPQESSIGFHEVDLEQTPSQVKKVFSQLANRQMVAWVKAAENNYIIINPEKNDTIKVDKVVQRVPGEDFLWLDVRLVDLDDHDNNKNETAKNNDDGSMKTAPMIIKLDRIEKGISGIGFDIRDEDDLPVQSTPEDSNTNQIAPLQQTPVKKTAPAAQPEPKTEKPPQPENKPSPENEQKQQKEEQQPQPTEQEKQTDQQETQS